MSCILAGCSPSTRPDRGRPGADAGAPPRRNLDWPDSQLPQRYSNMRLKAFGCARYRHHHRARHRPRLLSALPGDGFWHARRHPPDGSRPTSRSRDEKRQAARAAGKSFRRHLPCSGANSKTNIEGNDDEKAAASPVSRGSGLRRCGRPVAARLPTGRDNDQAHAHQRHRIGPHRRHARWPVDQGRS